MNGVQYIGNGEFVVTEELYPDYAKDYDSCQGVAEAMIYDWMNNAGKTD